MFVKFGGGAGVGRVTAGARSGLSARDELFSRFAARRFAARRFAARRFAARRLAARRLAARRFVARRFGAGALVVGVAGGLDVCAGTSGALETGSGGGLVAAGALEDGGGAGGALCAGALGCFARTGCSAPPVPPAPGATSGRGSDALGAGSGSGLWARAVGIHASARANTPKSSHPLRCARSIQPAAAVMRTVVGRNRPGQPGNAGPTRMGRYRRPVLLPFRTGSASPPG